VASPSLVPKRIARADDPISPAEDCSALGLDRRNISDVLDSVEALCDIEETSYAWNLRTDHIDWEPNAMSVLGLLDPAKIATGHAFQSLIVHEHVNRRSEAIFGKVSSERVRGVPYRTQYRLIPNASTVHDSIHLEDQGRWWPGVDGRPEYAQGVLRVTNAHYMQEQRCLHAADFDELTGQLNRIRLTQALAIVLETAISDKTTCGFLIVAINNLGIINSTYGFDAGDEAITAVGRRMNAKLRETDVLGRYASNKFAVVMKDCGPGALRLGAERFMKAVRDHSISTSVGPLAIAVSVGGVVIPDQATTVQQSIDCALRALDRAKSKRFECFMPYEINTDIDLARHRSKAIADDVIAAIDNHRMQLALQPLVNAKTGQPEIYECLLRMKNRAGQVVSAGEFIPIAEQLGLSRLVDRRTLELAVELLKQHQDLTLSINVSGLTCTDHAWLLALQKLTGMRRDILSRIIIEITETAALQDIDQSINFVDMLKDVGCRVAIDDFGAGYTSFKNLKLLNVDMVKIDGAFVKNLAEDASDQMFIKTMIELAKNFGMETVAEWVGDEKTIELLTDAGITYLQGFHYGQPFAAEDYKPRT
jgi:diguanylate cyclase (GGDEF)-like protein